MNKSIFALFSMVMLTSGCAKDCQINRTSSIVVAAAPDDVAQVVQAENDYRISVGQSPLTQGLSCTLYTVPNTTTQIVGATLTNKGSFTYNGLFNQPEASASIGLNILPSAFKTTYQSWFIVKCTGQLVITVSDYYQFDLTSDDGSNLYVSGLLVNNDGNHGSLTKSATKYLRKGVFSFELDFMQAAGNQSLILSANGVLVPAARFYH